MAKRSVSRRKEPKSIEEARPLILAMVPNGCRVHLFGHWSDSRAEGRAWSSVGYDCTVYGVTGKELIDVKAATPASLVAAVHRAFESLLVDARAAAARSEASRELTVVDVAQAPPSTSPRLKAPGRPLLRNGGAS